MLPLLALSACLHAPPRPLAAVPGTLREDAVAPGTPLVTLEGGPLAAPVVVPLWLDLRDPDPELQERAGWDTDVGWLPLPDGRIYVEQSNVRAGTACRVLDPDRGFVEPAGGCVESTYLRRSLEPVDAGLAVVRSSAEGCAAFQLVRWDGAPRVLLAADLGCMDGDVRWDRDGDALVLRSTCDLGTGGCPPFETGPDRTWRWTEAGGLVAER